jgi:hypothetical protein
MLRASTGVGRLFEYRLEGHGGSAVLFEGRIVHGAIL